MSIQKNVASQVIPMGTMLDTDGAAVTSGVTVEVVLDNGSATSGAGTATHKSNGAWTYAPTQAETNANSILVIFSKSGAVPISQALITQDYPRTAIPAVAANAVGGLPVLNSDSRVNSTLQDVSTDAQADIRAAVGLGTASLDTQLGDIPTVSEFNARTLAAADYATAAALATVDTVVDAILEDTAAIVTPPTAAAIADAVWDELQTGHTTAGTFGAYLDASVSGVSTGGVSAADIADAVLDEALAGHATAGTLGKAVADILVDTAEIGAAGAGLTAIPWNASWDTEVQSECTDALNAYDPPTKAELDSAVSPLATASALTTLITNVATVDGIVDEILVDTGTTLPASIADLPTASENATAILAAGDVDGYTLEQTLKLCLAALAGKVSGAGTTTIAIRAADDSKARITATVDTDGNRSALTLDVAG